MRGAKREAKTQFADWIKESLGQKVDPDSIFDCQVKRIHEYKRQLLNALRIVVLYDRLRKNPKMQMTPRTFCPTWLLYILTISSTRRPWSAFIQNVLQATFLALKDVIAENSFINHLT